MRISKDAIAIDVPDRWEGRIFRHPGGEPTLHAANFALPTADGDYGAGALAEMGSGGAFVAITEFDPGLATTALFHLQGLPSGLHARDFHPRQLQRRRPGQAGLQRFFHVHGRAFCLYAVIGTEPSREHLVRSVNGVLAALHIGPRRDG